LKSNEQFLCVADLSHFSFHLIIQQKGQEIHFASLSPFSVSPFCLRASLLLMAITLFNCHLVPVDPCWTLISIANKHQIIPLTIGKFQK